MLRAILNKSWRQYPTKHQLYGHLPPISKTIQVRRTRHAGHCWRSRDELISDLLLWTPTYGRARAERPARTYIQQLCEDTGCSPEDLPEAMNDREKWRERVRDIRASGMTWWWWWWRLRRQQWHEKLLQQPEGGRRSPQCRLISASECRWNQSHIREQVPGEVGIKHAIFYQRQGHWTTAANPSERVTRFHFNPGGSLDNYPSTIQRQRTRIWLNSCGNLWGGWISADG